VVQLRDGSGQVAHTHFAYVQTFFVTIWTGYYPVGTFTFSYACAQSNLVELVHMSNQHIHKPLVSVLYCVNLRICLHDTVSYVQIIIPFFSIFVKDIYVLNEGCLNR